MSLDNGRPVFNQFVITAKNGDKYFQSYNTTIAKIRKGKVYLDKQKWDCSRTTGKYRNMFLGEKIAETRKKIENGEYKLVDLNK